MKARKGGEAVNGNILGEYAEKIYKFALSKTFSEDEAEELSQEILLNALCSMPKLRDESRFEPWLWSLASNTARAFRRARGRQRAMFVYNAPEYLFEEAGESGFGDLEREETYSLLREKIAMLSLIYREIIILHYYDGLSVKEISEKLGIPLGTVTWRLSEARSKLKKGVNDMEAAALKPVKMFIGIYGSGNYNGYDRLYPGQLIDDALSQNILFNCYGSPKGIEELAALCGVPAYYIEDRIEALEKRRAIIQPSKGRYLTDFIIWQDKHGKYWEENSEAALMPIAEKLASAFSRLFEEAVKIDFYRAEKTEEELKYLYGAMAVDYLDKSLNGAEYPDIPQNYDGNKWRYVGFAESGKYFRNNMERQVSMHGKYRHISYGFAGIKSKGMMFKEYIEVCHDILTQGKTDNKNIAAHAAQKGFITIKDGVASLSVPYFTMEQKARFDSLAGEILNPAGEEYKKAAESFAEGYKKLFPKYLSDDAQRMCSYLFKDLFDAFSRYCIKNGILQKPENDWSCSVLLETE